MANPTGLISTATTPQAQPPTADPTQVQPAIPPAPPVTTAAPGLISSTLSTQTPANVASVAAPAQNTVRDVTANETVAGQLNSLLNQNSTYMQSAKANAAQAANAKGLLNSSLAVGAGQKAAIDSALPIAQQDAQTFAQSGQSAQQANQDLKQTGYNSLLSSAQNAENFGYSTKLNEQNIQGNMELQKQQQDAADALQTKLKQMDVQLETSKLNAQQIQSLASAMQPIDQQYQTEISLINRTPDQQMDQDAKKTALSNQFQQYQAQIQALASLYNMDIYWPPTVYGDEAASAQAAAEKAKTDAANSQTPAEDNTAAPPPTGAPAGGTWMGGYYYLPHEEGNTYAGNYQKSTYVYDQTGKRVMVI